MAEVERWVPLEGGELPVSWCGVEHHQVPVVPVVGGGVAQCGDHGLDGGVGQGEDFNPPAVAI